MVDEEQVGQPEEGQESSQPAPAAISLEDLSRAFADVMQMPQNVREPDSEATQSGASMPSEESVAITPGSILEAVLFVGSPDSAGVSESTLLDILKGLSAQDLEHEVAELNRVYEELGHPWRIVREQEGYAMQLVGAMESVLDRLQSTPRDHTLSQNAIDCLSLIAYQPGVTKDALEKQWGQSSGATLHYLMKKSLVRVERNAGHEEDRYFTTERFLEILGIDSLDDLPQGEEL